MHSTTFITGLLLTSTTGWARYTLQQDYMEGGNFLDQFTFFTAADPTDGFVEYVSEADAQMAGMINQTSTQVTLASDSTDTTTTGRKSIRITSNQSYQSGLVILDLAHMPGSVCGSWPAFWMVGPNWPTDGEIDIIEGVNDNTFNSMTLHTGPDCSIDSSTAGRSDVFSGTVSTTNCDINAPNQAENAGCSIDASASDTYGTGFNNAGGGVYAMELTTSGISIYFFSRSSIPSDITSGSPDPSTWGVPLSKFAGDCDFPTKFTQLQIVFDVTFCGSWAGAVWPNSTCAAQHGSSCENFVGQNPSAFAETFWTINSLNVYQSSGAASSGAAPSGPASTQAQSTFVRSTVPAWSSTGTAPWGTGFTSPAHGTSFAPPFNPHDSSAQAPTASSPGGFGGTAPAGSAQATSTAAAAPSNSPQGSSPAQQSAAPQETSAAPASSASQTSQAPAQSSAAQASQTETSAAPSQQSQTGAQPSHTWHFGGGNGFHHGGFGGGNRGGQADQVEAMTVSVSQRVPQQTDVATGTGTGVAEAEHSTASAGVEDVGVPANEAEKVRRTRHLRSHKHRFVGHGAGRF